MSLHRKALKNDSEKFNILVAHLRDRKTRLQDSSQKVLKLKQQLKAAAAIYKANKNTFDELSAKVGFLYVLFACHSEICLAGK
jgi:endonuclease III